ncbi:hypothetical protein BT96DRAFT_957615 [Gymnopus androsaceus JB14]|uniref:Uncharacterized protein n=1 Tax=Gymnopus androsaceus JB14 TaxID=1447944 RepID=A0A6A4HIN2_9AGAR|nr:hypothetical protein BT96DRAFT_957615 [Gymnopus androsaceus JB14]
MEIVTWALSTFGINNVPSVDVMKSVDDYLQSLCGIHTVCHQGALGHIYYMNDLAGIIRQEMANPWVRQHIHHYHEDSGRHLEHAWQAEAWRDLDPDLATPMVRMGHQDYYVYEVTRLKTDHGAQGYIVHEWDQVQVPVTSLLASLPHISESFELNGGYDPQKIIGVQKQPNEGLSPWTHTNWDTGSLNPWRIKAKNHRVLIFAMWVYCNDTSGNVSKKWNKHNSFLFTAAGLPREHFHRQSNIHFLSTSNLAPPLEMLDGFVDQLEAGQQHGIWAWDIEAKEMVLLIPAVLAMLGDNPMQSEFACHVGLTGKFFCHCCWAKGHDAEYEGPLPSQTPSTRASPIPSPSHIPATDTSSIHSDAGSEKLASGKRQPPHRNTFSKHQLRTPDDTKKTLKSIFTKSSTINGKTEAKQMMTQFGVKDTFLDHFRDKVLSFISKLPRGTACEDKQRETDKYVKEELPDDVYSFDPHRDTPIEILHVILLGFVKYYWCDAMTQLSDEQKNVLTHRLSSLDVSALGLSPLAGETLVKYARSLTGRDFRVIAQVAPFVLYDLFPKHIYDAWLALSALVPLVWQPAIEDLKSYLPKLELAIDRFLHSAAAWTPRWFNKPKFHILKHLPMHVPRFGPSILYTTEGFESFNAAPFARHCSGFARCNRNCHLLSKGFFLRPDILAEDETFHRITIL